MQKTLLLGFFFLALHGFGQGFSNQHRISLSVGPSFPVGGFAAKQTTKETAGFAQTGLQASVSYVHPLGRRMGFAVMLLGQRHALDTRALEQEFDQTGFSTGIYTVPGPFPAPEPSYTYFPNWTFDKDAWVSGSLLVGGEGLLPVGSGGPLSLMARAMVGAAYTSSPKLQGSSVTDTAVARYRLQSGSGFGLACLVRGGVQYSVTDKVSVVLSADYFGTKTIIFPDVRATFTSARYVSGVPTETAQSTVTDDGRQKLGAVNISMGIGLKL